jgi:hypothetical protein
VLFLNKIDLVRTHCFSTVRFDLAQFQQKLITSPIRKHFPEYRGRDGDYYVARDFFKKRFLSLNRDPHKLVYAHFTCVGILVIVLALMPDSCALDTDLVRVTMAAVTVRAPVDLAILKLTSGRTRSCRAICRLLGLCRAYRVRVEGVVVVLYGIQVLSPLTRVRVTFFL